MDLMTIRTFAEGTLRSYGQILFSRSLLVGALLIGATAVTLPTLLLGLGAAVVAQLVARLLEMSPDSTRDGIYGYNALLVGVGGGALFEPTGTAIVITLVAAAASVPVTAAFHAALGQGFGLPTLTLPFIAVFVALLAAAPATGVQVQAFVPSTTPMLPEAVDAMLTSVGAIFFLPRAAAGALILVALVINTRIGTLLAALAFAVTYLLASNLVAPTDATMMVLGLNAMFTAFALGGIWFVPSMSSFVLAVGGAVVSSGVAIGLAPVAQRLGVPLLILPFNITVLLFLYALRQRMSDGRPKSVDFILGTPEENLTYFRTRLARFGARYAVRFSAPFLGRWRCTQGPEGEITHQGPWRHGFDFEVFDAVGRKHRRDGKRLEHYFCYRLPVVTPADGTVIKVVDDIPDNQPGEQNLDQNWGNLVLTQHGLGLYSLLCHLAPASIRVREGQIVRRGDILGLCGASGRAPEPHLHLQFQASDRIGAPTIEGELHDVMLANGDDDERLFGTVTPDRDDVIRNLDETPDVARCFDFEPGHALVFDVDDGRGAARREEVALQIDLYGNLVLRSKGASAALFYAKDDRMFTVYDVVGSRRSVLHVLRTAMSRIVFEAKDGFEWTDFVPRRFFSPLPVRVLLDFVSPFLEREGIEMRYRLEQDGETRVFEGRSVRTTKDGGSLITTRAVIGADRRIAELSVTVRGRTTTARLREDSDHEHPARVEKRAGPTKLEATT